MMNPMSQDKESNAWWDLGLVAVTVYAGWKLMQGVFTSVFKPTIPGLTWQPADLTQVEIAPKTRGSIDLTLLPDPDHQLLQSVQLLFEPGGEVTVTPAAGIIAVSPIAGGVLVAATGRGSALITIVFPPDTTGVNDAIVGIGVF